LKIYTETKLVVERSTKSV